MSSKKTERGAGDGRRLPRVEKEIREVVGQYLLRGFRGKLTGLVTVSRVIASHDLKTAKILVIVMPKAAGQAKAEADDKLKTMTIAELQAHVHEVQAEVNRQLKMKHCPKLKFYYDDGVGHAMKMEGILRGLKPSEKDGGTTGAGSAEVALADGGDARPTSRDGDDA